MSADSEPSTSGDFGTGVHAVVRSIPPGHYMTYGDIAAVLGSRGARSVGRVMALEGHALPWWRVVRSGGHPPRGLEARALEYYEAENTPMTTPGIDGVYRLLPSARYAPPLD
ncbi:MGMT family protein [Humidisolicoccus flavus]|uniref:MGMT family protein n=1 Tax=Humidisolicoccus flavus TaxID=3111414 RepID=UPI00324AF7BF